MNRARIVQMQWDKVLFAFRGERVITWCLCVETVDGDRNGKIAVYEE